jgi:dolichol-phosphate mannosyltransferase/undecaprenyl-phosphate 4-deoxy-4-formamido-L-arabinose transferase
MSPTYSVVVPVYNSTTSLYELVKRLDRVFVETVQCSYEIIFVDDGSPNPQTWLILQELADTYPTVKSIQLMRNFGKAGAVMCGFAHVSNDYVFTLDDDLQHRPEDIPKFIEHDHHDVVIGYFKKKQTSLMKRMTSAVKSRFDDWVLDKPREVINGPYKMYKARVVEHMLSIRTPHPSVPALLFYTTKDVVNIELPHDKRKFGKSSFGFIRRVKQFSNLLINNSSFLLRTIAAIGILVSTLSVFVSIYYIARRLLLDIRVPGFTTLVVATLMMNGLILFTLGIIGEYLLRIIKNSESRPSYLVRHVYHKSTTDE